MTTPEFTTGWLRVLSKVARKMRMENEELTARKYARAMTKTASLYAAVGICSWPIRRLQEIAHCGSEAFLLLRRPK
jgi:hypothetical protein